MKSNKKKPRVVLDTDTYNEVDDQFALAHLMLSQDVVNVEAVYAAPFHNDRSSGPEDGMERSYEEIQRVLDLLGKQPAGGVFKGSRRYLEAADVPEESPAACDLVERAMKGDSPLVVCAIGAITNVASALLLEPKIADRIEIVWLGGNAPYWPHTREFNLQQDPHASRLVMSGIAPMVQIPCMPVASHLLTTYYELEALLAPFSPLGKYLTDIVHSHTDNVQGWAKPIWDIAASAYVIDPKFCKTIRRPAPVLTTDLRWEDDPMQKEITVVTEVDRDAIFRDFFCKAREFGATM